MTNDALKIIQLSDPHLVPKGRTVHGADPLMRLKAAVADINEHHRDAALVVISGDLANDGERGAYEALSEAVSQLSPPFRLMPGNHDERALIRKVLPDAASSPGVFIQDTIDTQWGRLILLDTLDAGRIEGTLDESRLAWLKRELDDAAGRPVFIFMHHPPFPIHMAEFDAGPMTGAAALRDLLLSHGKVRHIFAGHVHRFIAGSWHGIPLSILRSTSHQTALHFGMGWRLGPETPGYAIIFIDEAGAIVHFHEFPI